MRYARWYEDGVTDLRFVRRPAFDDVHHTAFYQIADFHARMGMAGELGIRCYLGDPEHCLMVRSWDIGFLQDGPLDRLWSVCLLSKMLAPIRSHAAKENR